MKIQYLFQNGATAESLDMRIPDAWVKGYTGKGVVVSILDDGVQSKHPDLMANYVSICPMRFNMKFRSQHLSVEPCWT